MSKTMDSDDEDKPNIKLIAVLDHDAAVPITDEMDTEPSTNNIDGYCTECEDQPTQLFCEQCQDDFCDVCFQSIHRKGTRKKHTTKKLVSKYSNTTSNGINSKMSKEVSETSSASQFSSPVIIKGAIGDWFINRSKYIPLRLTYQERKYLRLLEAALNVSEYTDKIDIVSYTSKAKRIVAQIKELCSILSGLVLAADYKIGQELFKNRDFAQNKNFFQDIFELGRRHKIMNPEKMRESYGKLLYLLQDSQMPEIKEMLEFDCVIPIKTVYKVLEENGCLEVLSDEIIVTATQEIITSPGKSRNVIQNEIRQKERSIEILSKKYEKKNISADLIKQCLYSIGDNHSFLRANRDPCDQMIAYLKRHINPEKVEADFSLAIQSGRGGARLSHDHSKQFNYVLQSLTLWREIQHDMFQLWMLAEDDILSETNSYRLRDTGQGLNRIQSAPRVSRMMQTILQRAQQKVGYWVGSSVVHLGDHNVPNALMFIDKYTQIYRILLPLCTTLEKIDEISKKDEDLFDYIKNSFHDVETAKKVICTDFFKYAFDGSGADNFFDAGSCIDGRLTSAWNWCSKLEKKSYFPLFLLTGFTGFDGQFN